MQEMVRNYDASAEGKEEERLSRRKNMNDKEKEKLSQYNLRRDRMVADREAAKAAEKTVKDKITKLVDEEAKDDLEGYYHAIQCHYGRTKVLGAKLLTMEAHGTGRMLER